MGEEPPPEAEKPEGEDEGEKEKNIQNFSLSSAFAAIAKDPISLGYVNGKEIYTALDPETGTLGYTVGLPPPPPPPEPEKKSKYGRRKPKVEEEAPPPEPEEQEEKAPEVPLDVVGEGWL